MKHDATLWPSFPPGWMRFKDKCFMFKGKENDIKANWTFASSWCKDQGGELAIIDNQYENGELNPRDLKQSRSKRRLSLFWPFPLLQTLCPVTWRTCTAPRGSACQISWRRISTPGVTGSAPWSTPTGTKRSPTTQEERSVYSLYRVVYDKTYTLCLRSSCLWFMFMVQITFLSSTTGTLCGHKSQLPGDRQVERWRLSQRTQLRLLQEEMSANTPVSS